MDLKKLKKESKDEIKNLKSQIKDIEKFIIAIDSSEKPRKRRKYNRKKPLKNSSVKKKSTRKVSKKKDKNTVYVVKNGYEEISPVSTEYTITV